MINTSPVHTAILAGTVPTFQVYKLVQRLSAQWDERYGILKIQIAIPAGSSQTLPDDASVFPDQSQEQSNFVSVGLLTGDALFICTRNGLSVLTDSIRLLSRIFPLSLSATGVAHEMSRFIPERYKAHSPWTGVHRVPPGFRAYIGTDSTWNITHDPSSRDFGRAYSLGGTTTNQLKLQLRDSVMRSIKGATRIAADLSGGMDSTSICALLTELGEQYTPAHVGSSDKTNLDRRYADIAATELGTSLTNLGDSRMVAGAFDSTYHGYPQALEEGIPTWVGGDMGFARRAAFASQEGYELYLVGLGGDELFSMQYGALFARDREAMDLVRYRTLIRSLSAAGTWRSNLRMIHMNRFSPGQEAKMRLHSKTFVSGKERHALADLGWLSGLKIPSYLAAALSEEISDGVISFAETDEFYLHDERFKHVILESIVKQAKTLASVNKNFASGSSLFRAPFLDPALVALVISFASTEFDPVRGHKHLLKAGMGDSLPAAIRTRTDKGELSSELYESFAANRDTVRRTLNNSQLVDLGVVDGDSLKALLSGSMYSTSALMELEEVYHAEKWVRTVPSFAEGSIF